MATTVAWREVAGANAIDEEGRFKRIEPAFWEYLRNLGEVVQIIVFENKTPPDEVADNITYEYFAGPTAAPGEREGFIPLAT